MKKTRKRRLVEADDLTKFVKPEIKAKQLFGTTNNVGQAAYVTKSGQQDMIKSSYGIARRDISQAWHPDAKPTDAHTAFLDRGNVGFDHEKRRVEFEVEPTPEQLQAIGAFVSHHGGDVDVVFPGRRIRQFHGGTFQQVMQAIVSFFHPEKRQKTEGFRAAASEIVFEACEFLAKPDADIQRR